MCKKNKHNTFLSSNFFRVSVVAVLFLIFTNFTFAIQYVNLNTFNLTLNEIVEEEEKEEHKQDLLELLVNDDNVIQFLNVELKEPIIEAVVSEVSTPPPDCHNIFI